MWPRRRSHSRRRWARGPASSPTSWPTAERPASDAVASALRQRTDLRAILEALPPTERTVITLRFGLEDEAPMTLEAIGQRLGVTRERIRQIEGAALRKLRARLEARGVGLPDA